MTFVERLTLISSVAALISSFAALATAIAQIFISRASSLWAYRLETSKLVYQSKTEAYQAFLTASQQFLTDPSHTNTLSLTSSCSYAILFSENSTCAALSLLSNALIKFRQAPSAETSADVAAAQTLAVEAMRQEFVHLRDPLDHRFRYHKHKVHTAHKD